MGTRSSIRSVFGVLLLLLGGCAGTPPVRELRVYDTAFSELRSAGELVLDEVAIAITARERLERRLRGETEPLYPHSFDPEAVSLDAGADEPAVIRVRRLAFRTVADYNEALLAMAEGRPLTQVQGRVATLGGTVQSLLPLVGIAGGPLPGLVVSGLQSAVSVAERAREREVVERAILAGHEDVNGILEALIADTPDLYTLLRSRHELELDAAEKEMGDLRRQMLTLAGMHQPATDPSDVKAVVRTEQRVDTAFAAITPISEAGSLPSLNLVPAAAGVGAPFGAPLLNELESRAGRIEAASARYARAVEAINLEHEAIGEYVLLLRRTRRSLEALQVAATVPPDANEILLRVLEAGVELRHQADQVQEIFRVLRTG